MDSGAGHQGGRPPDLVEIVEIEHVEDRSSLPVSPGLQPLQKRGRGADLWPSNANDMEMGTAEGGVDGEMVAGRNLVESEKRATMVSSFKEKLLGSNGGLGDAQFSSELDVKVQEEDVRVGGNSTLPEIQFSDRIHDAIDAKLASIQSMWNPVGGMSLIDLDNDYYLVCFALQEDFNKVLTGGPWVIYGSYLTVQAWSRYFSTAELYLSQIMVWVRLPKLPYRYYTKSLFRHIASSIGKVVKVDYNTTEGRRGRFARLVIIVDLNKPLISGIIIDGQRQDIEYEGLPTICYKCGRIGHSIDNCGKHEQEEGERMESSRPRDPTELYRPWMQATGSRFVILDEDACTEEEGLKSGSGRVPTSSAVAKNVPSEPNTERTVEKVQLSRASRSMETIVCEKEVISMGESSMTKTRVDNALKTVAALEKVLPVKSSLAGDKHSAVQVMGGSVSTAKRVGKGRVLPSSIIGLQPRESSKIGVGKSNGLKPGNKPKKRDDRGLPNSGLAECISSLVADLDRAADEEKGHGVTDHKCDPSDTDGVQWRANSAFERPRESDMQDKKPDMMALFEPRINGVAVDNFIRRSGFECSYRVEAQGFSGGEMKPISFHTKRVAEADELRVKADGRSRKALLPVGSRFFLRCPRKVEGQSLLPMKAFLEVSARSTESRALSLFFLGFSFPLRPPPKPPFPEVSLCLWLTFMEGLRGLSSISTVYGDIKLVSLAAMDDCVFTVEILTSVVGSRIL
ncbi:hypothetical protein GQ457_05G011030 [Hibiscus cannabinus]